MGVGSKAEYAEFERKRDEWVEAFYGDDHNSIENQICDMVEDAGYYRVLLKARKNAVKSNDNQINLNPYFHRLIDKTFFESQASAIRRQLDSRGVCGKQGVWSLMSLIKDMEKHKFLLIRQNIFKAEDLEYDYEKVEKDHEEYVRQKKTEGHGKIIGIPHQNSSWFLKLRHESIDDLCRVCGRDRMQEDSVDGKIFKLLKKCLNRCGRVEAVVDKFIAHAATPRSRKKFYQKIRQVPFEEIWAAHKRICTVAAFISNYFFPEKYTQTFLPVMPKDYFDQLDKPLIRTEYVDIILDDVWSSYEKEVKGWSNRDWGDFMSEFEIG